MGLLMVAQRKLRNAGQLVRIGASYGIAEFISNSAIWPLIWCWPALAVASNFG